MQRDLFLPSDSPFLPIASPPGHHLTRPGDRATFWIWIPPSALDLGGGGGPRVVVTPFIQASLKPQQEEHKPDWDPLRSGLLPEHRVMTSNVVKAASPLASAVTGAMELSVAQWLLVVCLVAFPLLYEWSVSFKYFCKMAFYNGWILTLAILAIPICAVRGRNVENMKVLRFMLLHIKYLYGIKIEVRGWENFDIKEPYVVVSNHQSSLDLLGMMEILPGRCVPIAKRELMYAGTAGLACWLAGVIFINRKKTDDAISVMSEAAETMLQEDVRVWVFPEGTRNHKGSLLPFKRGAFHLAVQAQVPVIPVIMSSYKDFYSKKDRKFTTGKCTVQILPGVPTKGLCADDVPDLADKVREMMLETLTAISNERPGKEPGGLH